MEVADERVSPFGDWSTIRPVIQARSGMLILFLCLLAGRSSMAQEEGFGEPRVITTQADGAVWVVAADLDGDGDQDVLSASLNSHEVAWSENIDGLGFFEPKRIITTEAQAPYAVTAADIDGDNDLDVLVAGYSNWVCGWCENIDGLGTFGPLRIITTTARGPRSIFAADVDGDNDQDVLLSSLFDDTIAWYENTDGLGTFGPQRTITTLADSPRCIFAVDVDGDNDQDLLSASYHDDKIAWYENLDGFGSFGPQRIITTAADGAYSVFAADVNGDNDVDVLSASFTDDTIAWYENLDGHGNFGPRVIISTLADGARSVFAADVDEDGDWDVLSASSNDDKIAWYENLDNHGFAVQKVITTLANNAYAVCAADLDGNGTWDALSASADDDKIASYPYGTLATCTWYCGTGVNAGGYTVVANAVLGSFFTSSVTHTRAGALLYGYPQPLTFPYNGQEILVDFMDPNGELLGNPLAFGSPAVFSIQVPRYLAAAGFTFHVQAVSFGGGIDLHCAYSCVIGF